MLSICLPINILCVYLAVGAPVYSASSFSESPYFNANYNIDELLGPGWPRSGGLEVDVARRSVTFINGLEATPVILSSQACYRPNDPEYRILAKILNETWLKQAGCESVLGKMLAEWHKERKGTTGWQRGDDFWVEIFDFTVRLFGALAGLVANRAASQMGGGFLEDMLDIFDMYMLTFADVDQLREGRPLLSGGLNGIHYHKKIHCFILLAYSTMIMRALAIVGFKPISSIIAKALVKCGISFPTSELHSMMVAVQSLSFVEIPFLWMRWSIWNRYGVRVSVLAVKNLFGIYLDLVTLGLLHGIGESQGPRGFRYCCMQSGDERDRAVADSSTHVLGVGTDTTS